MAIALTRVDDPSQLRPLSFAALDALCDDLRAVVAVVGDGALTGGLAYEALNNIGVRSERVVVVLNDNGRSYAPTVSRLFGLDGTAFGFFEALGFDYEGPIDGHDLVALEAALHRAKAHQRPVVVHVHTI